MPDNDQFIFRVATLDEIVALRHDVLRHGLPRQTAIFPGDDAPTTLHFGAFANVRNICCATLHAGQWESRPAWQLRGMATHPDYRGRGVGRAMMRFVESTVIDTSPVRVLWCNARVPASKFYVENGWSIVSEQFEIPSAGPHFRMTKELKS